MKILRVVGLISFLAVALVAAPLVAADDFKLEPGFVSLFNGKDLTGWNYSNGEKFDGKTATPDGRFTGADGVLAAHEVPPRLATQIWTTKEFPKDFVLRLEFRATVGADSGIFLRKPQLQCRDYLVAGPYKQLKQYKPQEWNVVEVVVKEGVARCTCNGEVLEEALKVPATGPIGLEVDRGVMEYRRIRIKEMQ